MNRWVEERAEAIRLALRVRGFPCEADLYRLVDWLDGCIVLRHGPVPLGMCVHQPDHRGVITLPQAVQGRKLDLILAEEIGHYLLTTGMAVLLRQLDPEDYRTERLARRWEGRDEALARQFVQSWFLPSRLVQEIPDDEELAEQSGCSLELVRERRESLQGEIVELTEPARWSARRVYRLEVEAAAGARYLQVVPVSLPAPRFLLPLPESEQEDLTMQVAADLLALTLPEFEIKYGPFRSAGRERIEVQIADLREWAGRSGR